MAEQLVLDLPHRPAMGADDFLVSSCNERAIELIDRWPAWTDHVHLIEGPAGSGKSHLANVWRLKSDAELLDPARIDIVELSARRTMPCLVLEDMDRSAFDDQAVFHLMNLARERDFDVLFTAGSAPARWDAQLPDLVSRLRAMPVARIGMPDDALLGAVLLKHFSDRQLNVEPQVIKFLATRTVRSMEAVRELAAAIDHAALSKGRKITRNLASEVIEEFQSDEPASPG